MNLWLVGTGQMAQDYTKVLQALNISIKAIGRGTASADSYEKVTGIVPITGGIRNALKNEISPELVIIAVGVEQLAETATVLIKAGTKKILIEKPAGVNFKQIQQLNEVAIQNNADVYLAYNRRYYTSTLKLEELIAEDGGVTSMQFEFTEWSHKICDLPLPQEVKKHWLLANSTHVMDLAFYLCGVPIDWKNWYAGSLDWHPSAARFCGAGVTDRGVLFSYIADWGAPGRWGLEVLTRNRRFFLRPMETLQVTLLGSVQLESIELDDQIDRDFKPGLYRQTTDFIANESARFCTLSRQVELAELYSKIGGY